MLSSYWPRDGSLGVIEIGPERGWWLRCSVREEWRTVLSRTLRCGKKHSLSVTQRRGISAEDKSKLVGLLESGIGIKGVAHLKAKVESTLALSVKLEEMTERTEKFELEVGKCDENQLLLAQKMRVYHFEYEHRGLFFKSGEFEIVEFVDEIWDKGRVIRNHPDCQCKEEPRQSQLLAGLRIGSKVFDVEGIDFREGQPHLDKLGLKVEAALNEAKQTVVDPDRSFMYIRSFMVPRSNLPPYWNFLIDGAFDPEVRVEAVLQPRSPAHPRQYRVLFGAPARFHVESFDRMNASDQQVKYREPAA